MHRARPSASRDVEGFGHRLGHLGEAFGAHGPLGDGLEHLVDKGGIVGAMERLQWRIQRHSAANMHHGRGRSVGLRHAGHGIHAAGPGRYDADAGLAGEASVGVGHQGRIGLHLAGDHADRGNAADAVIDRMDVRAGHAEHALDAFLAQGFRHCFARMHGRALCCHEFFPTGALCVRTGVTKSLRRIYLILAVFSTRAGP